MTAPMTRRLGLPMEFVDKPVEVAQALMASEIEDAIAEYEPRASVQDIEFNIDGNVPGRMVPIVYIEIDDEDEGGTMDS